MTKAKNKQKKQILLIEEDPDVIEVFRGLFEIYKKQVKLSIAPNASEALKCLGSLQPHLVLLDIMLPYGDTDEEQEKVLKMGTDQKQVETGLKILNALRKGKIPDAEKDVPVVAITARIEKKFLDEVKINLGEKGWLLNKPFDDFVLEVLACDLLGLKCEMPADEIDSYREQASRAKAVQA